MLDSAFRFFIDIVDINTYYNTPPGLWPEPQPKPVTYYEVGRLSFDLLPISLSRLEALGDSEAMQEISNWLRSHPPFHLVKNDPLELEKDKTAQVIKGFLKV